MYETIRRKIFENIVIGVSSVRHFILLHPIYTITFRFINEKSFMICLLWYDN